MIFAISDVVWQALIAGAVALGLGYMQRQNRNAIVKVGKEAAEHVNEVKDTLADNTDATNKQLKEISNTGKAVHTLVNSSMSAQLKISAVALRRIAVISKDQEDVKAADLAERLFHEHEVKQAVVDSGKAS